MFHPSYNGNCLVNAFTLGILPADKIFRGTAAGVGNPVMYIGAKTGRDGIHGATMASAEFDASTEEKRPTVQVGDPFMEKLLLEACLELFQTDAVVGIQDMGAAGLTSSSVEMAGRAGNGLDLFLDQVPLPRGGHDAVRDPPLRVAGADAPRRRGGQGGRGPPHLRRSGTSTSR